MNNTENTHEENLEANQLTEKLIAAGLDDFDLSIRQCIHSLVDQIRQHRNITTRQAKKIVAGLIETKGGGTDAM